MRQTSEILLEIKRTQKPVLITMHDVPRAYLVDSESFELQQRRIEFLENILRGEKDFAEGRVVSHEEAQKRLSRWLDPK